MTNSKIEFYWYKDRNMYIPFANNKLSGGTQELSAWMDDEIGNSLSSVELVINDFLVFSKKGTTTVYSGNAHSCFLGKNEIIISCDYIEEYVVLMTYEQIFYLLEQYKGFIMNKKKYKNNECKPESIDVEFIAEGISAFDVFNKMQNNEATKEVTNVHPK